MKDIKEYLLYFTKFTDHINTCVECGRKYDAWVLDKNLENGRKLSESVKLHIPQ